MDSNANTVPPQSSSETYVYSTLKKYLESDEVYCKPPAVPPKTYLEEEVETSSATSLPQEDNASTANDSCSVGSDSLYDMKLEAVNVIDIPERGLTSEPTKVASGNGREKQSVKFQISGTKQCQDGRLQLKKNLVCNMESNESNYQRIDTKAVNLPNRYETIDKQANSGDTNSGTQSHQHSTTISHYESLQLKTMKKPSVYEQVTLKKNDM